MPCRVFPSDFQTFDTSPAFARELDTLRTLQQGLSQGYCVFHSVHWTRTVSPKSRAIGEIDFIVMNREGDLLLIEQKTGPLSESDGQIWKSYGQNQSDKSVLVQMQRNQDGLTNKYRKLTNEFLNSQLVLFCPDYKILEAKISGMERNQIVDATDSSNLCTKLMNLLPEGSTSPKAKVVERFLKNELLIQEDLIKISAAQDTYTTRLAAGLTEWVGRLELCPDRLWVQGTAGSGKTQLALSQVQKAHALGLKALYVAFNKPLAQHMGEILPSTAKSISFYSFCEELVRAEDPDLARKKGFLTDTIEDLFELAAAIEPSEPQLFDVLIVDEGQDFTQAQADFLLGWCKPNGKILWLEDPLQNIYFKSPVVFEGWSRLHAPVNYRNPKPIAELLAQMAEVIQPSAGEELFGANSVSGFPVAYYHYDSDKASSLKNSTEAAVQKFLAQGFLTSQISVLTFKGLKQSKILQMTHLNGSQIKKPDDKDISGYTNGDIEVDTLFRFKGLSNLAIVLTEVEFKELSQRTAQLLFVGASRAKLALAVVHDSPLEKLI